MLHVCGRLVNSSHGSARPSTLCNTDMLRCMYPPAVGRCSSAAHLRLVVGGCGEDLALLGGDGGVAIDHAREDAAQGLDAQGQGGHVQQQDVLWINGVRSREGCGLKHTVCDWVDMG